VAHLQAAAECARGNNDITREYMFGIILRAYLFGDTLTEAARSFGVTAQEWQRIERTLQRDRKNPKSQLIMMVLQVVDEHSLPIELRN